MYYLFNPQTLQYVGRKKNRFFATGVYKDAITFDNEFVAKNVVLNGNLPKDIKGRDGFIVMHEKGMSDKLSGPVMPPTEEEINKKADFSFEDLERIVKQNTKKVKTVYTYLQNIYESTKGMEKVVDLLENKIVLIYHYIESGACKTDEEKLRIANLLERTLLLRREVKKQRGIFASMSSIPVLDHAKHLKEKTAPFEYWDYGSIEDFIKTIEEAQEVIK